MHDRIDGSSAERQNPLDEVQQWLAAKSTSSEGAEAKYESILRDLITKRQSISPGKRLTLDERGDVARDILAFYESDIARLLYELCSRGRSHPTSEVINLQALSGLISQLPAALEGNIEDWADNPNNSLREHVLNLIVSHFPYDKVDGWQSRQIPSNMKALKDSMRQAGGEAAREMESTISSIEDMLARQRLLDMGIGDMTPRSLEKMRRTRTFERGGAPPST